MYLCRSEYKLYLYGFACLLTQSSILYDTVLLTELCMFHLTKNYIFYFQIELSL